MKPLVDLHNMRQKVELDKEQCVHLSCEASYMYLVFASFFHIDSCVAFKKYMSKNIQERIYYLLLQHFNSVLSKYI